MRDFAWMLRRHEDDILNYFRMPIDNGTVEGLNNKAKLVIHKAYGFRTVTHYIRNLYQCMADLQLPTNGAYICVRNLFSVISGQGGQRTRGPAHLPADLGRISVPATYRLEAYTRFR